MFTSCGWFFDDIARLEPIQIFRYASRAMQLANEISGISLEDEYLRILKKANCNDRKYKNGADVYVKEVNSVITNFERVGAHFAISSLFRDNPKQNLVNGFIVENKKNNKVEIGTKKLGIGLSDFQSVITEQKKEFYYAAIHLGDNNMLGGISENIDQETMENIEETLTESFYRNDVSKIMDILDEFFGSHSYSFWHLFRDEQIFIIDKILEQKKKDLKDNYRQLYNNNYPFMRLLVDRQIAMPRSLSIPGEFIVNQDLLETIQTKPLDIQKIHRLTEQAESFHFDLDKTTLDFVLSKEILDLLHQLKSDKREINHLINISFFLTLAGELEIELNLWKSQNVFYHILNNEKLHQAIINNAGRTEKENEAWLLHFNNVGKLLKIKV